MGIVRRIKKLLGLRQVSNKPDIMKRSFVSKDSQIGAYTYIGFNTFVSNSKIGRYSSIANNVSIGNGEHLIYNLSTSSLFYDDPYRILTAGECEIGNDVWIGVGCTVRRGVKVGNGAVLGANSFVNKDVPPYAVVGGVPAKIIKFRFTPEQIEVLEKSKWWDLDFDQAKLMLVQLKKELAIDG